MFTGIVREFLAGLLALLMTAAPAATTVQPAEEPAYVQEVETVSPARTLSATAGTLSLDVDSPVGSLPKAAKASLSKVSKAKLNKIRKEAAALLDTEIIDAVAFDISFLNNGVEIEPDGKVNITVNFPAIAEAPNYTIIHFRDDGSAEVIPGNVTRTSATFSSDAFSVYAVVGTPEILVPRVILNFYNGSTLIETMYVKKADTAEEIEKIVYDPGAGTIPAGQVFKGWTEDPNYTLPVYDDEGHLAEGSTILLSIAQIRTAAMTTASNFADDAENPQDVTVNYYAGIFKQFKVDYVDADGITLGTEIAEIPSRLTEAEYKVNMGYTTDDAHNFEGWLVVEGFNNFTDPENPSATRIFPNGEIVKITGNVKFSVVAPEGFWLIFNENGKGATYNAPRFIKSGQVTSEADLLDMVRKGYTFKGWYTGAPSVVGGEPTGSSFVFGQPLTATTTVYAKWETNETADYTVIVWKQNVDGEEYDFKESVLVKNARVGSTPAVVNESGAVTGGTYTGETGFHFKETDQADQTVAPEGNTVVNVYWDRNEITFNFNTYGYTYTPTTGNNGTQYGLVDGEYVELWRGMTGTWYLEGTLTAYRGTRYTRSGGWTIYTTMTGLYGSTLEANDYEWPTEYDWYETGGNNGVTSGTRTTFLDAFLPASASTTVNFYGSTPAGSNHIYFYKQNANGNGYTLANTVNTDATGFNLSDKYNGFKCVAWNTSNNTNNWNVVGELMNQSGNFYYDAKPNQSGYQTADIGTNGLHIYFNRLSYALNFMDGAYFDGNGNPVSEPDLGHFYDVQNITYGADISSYNKGGSNYYEPTAPAGYAFEGWCIDDSCTQAYTFSTLPEGGLTVYARWRQIQYRVFLHPNVDSSDTTLNWGSETQTMNFRVTYGGKVSVPKGTRRGYEFYGWYTDAALTQAFSANTVLNDTTVSSSYNKTEKTDNMDKWGNIISGSPVPEGETGPGYNSDLYDYDPDTGVFTLRDRFWITRKLDLYGKWSAIVIGSDGIGVNYDANGGSNPPSDSALYIDNTSVSAGAAPTAPAGKVFDHWILQTWNGDAYANTDITVYAGDTFTILVANAKVTDASTGAIIPLADVIDDGIHHYNYTVQLKAVYKDKEVETPTHIAWYSNYGTENDGKGTLYRYDKKDAQGNDTLKINEAVDILAAPSRDGYTFMGWTKTKGGSTANFLVWDGTQYKTTDGTVVTQVAADEKTPIDDLYAVWDGYFEIYHSGVGENSIERIYLKDLAGTTTFNITAALVVGNKTVYNGLTSGKLYGGYYPNAGVSISGVETVKDGTQYPAYDGSNWTWNYDNAMTSDGTKIAVSSIKAGDFYYLKEVPSDYLKPYTYMGYFGNNISTLMLMTAIDDLSYENGGFVFQVGEGDKNTVSSPSFYKKFTVTAGNQKEILTVAGINEDYKEKTGSENNYWDITTGYLGYWKLLGADYIGENIKITVTQWWQTPDLVTVTGTVTRVVSLNDATTEGIAYSDTVGTSTITGSTANG